MPRRGPAKPFSLAASNHRDGGGTSICRMLIDKDRSEVISTDWGGSSLKSSDTDPGIHLDVK